MRKCIRCNNDMIENLLIRIDGKAAGVVISKNMNLFKNKICTPKIAICPNCGEMSMYIEDPNDINL